MKPLDRQQEIIFRRLTDGLTKVGDSRKIDGSINVEVVEQTSLGPLVSIAHQSGQANVVFLISSVKAITADLVKDAEEFVYPVSYRRNSLNWESLVVENGRWKVHYELQQEICRFANQWIPNIDQS